jgi:hypothetical protein
MEADKVDVGQAERKLIAKSIDRHDMPFGEIALDSG